jgi:hypothetical protein
MIPWMLDENTWDRKSLYTIPLSYILHVDNKVKISNILLKYYFFFLKYGSLARQPQPEVNRFKGTVSRDFGVLFFISLNRYDLLIGPDQVYFSF